MQHRPEFGGLVEITRFDPQQRVGEEARARSNMQAKRLVLARIEQNCTDHKAAREHDREGGKNAADATGVKRGEVQAAEFNPFSQYRRDQEARNHKEDVDADEAAMRCFREIMVGDHAADGYGAKPIDVWAIASGR